jgi:hypothetical protein
MGAGKKENDLQPIMRLQDTPKLDHNDLSD